MNNVQCQRIGYSASFNCFLIPNVSVTGLLAVYANIRRRILLTGRIAVLPCLKNREWTPMNANKIVPDIRVD
jgi:hypothetical protein